MDTPLAPVSQRKTSIALRISITLGCVAVAVMAFYALNRAKKTRWMKTCQENLTKIDGSKEQWALENNKTPGTPVSESDLVDPYEGYPVPKCPSGCGEYRLNPIGTDPVCISGLPGHLLSEVGDAITELE